MKGDNKMKWIEILQKNDIALLQNEKDTEFVVASGYDPKAEENQQWDRGSYFTYFDRSSKASYLQAALELFRRKTENNYITRARLEELSTLFKDGLIADDEDSAMEYFENCCKLTEEEKEFFGIEER